MDSHFKLTLDDCARLVKTSSELLQFSGGDAMRCASRTYAMVQAWELTRSDSLKAAIEQSLTHLTRDFIKKWTLPGNIQSAFLVSNQFEIELSGNALCILALTKYAELTDSTHHIALVEMLAQGMVAMFNPDTRRFVHVLNYPDLTVKEQFRGTDHDGKAVFALTRLYRLTGVRRWMLAVELAFEYFVEAKHWQVSDQYLIHGLNELILYKPKRQYFELAVQVVLNNVPDSLECLASIEQIIFRLKSIPGFSDLVAQLDYAKLCSMAHLQARDLPHESGKLHNISPDEAEQTVSVLLAYQNFLARTGHTDSEHCHSVPDNAHLLGFDETELSWGPIRLLGACVQPSLLNHGDVLWVETYWSTSKSIADEARLAIHGHNIWDLSSAKWEPGAERLPGAWMIPTSRWVPGKVYRDVVGLILPSNNPLRNGMVHVKVRWASPTFEKRELTLSQCPARVVIRHDEHPVKLNIGLADLFIWFLNQDMGIQRTGIENAALLRAQLFTNNLRTKPVILTCKYNPNLHDAIASLKVNGALHKDQTVRSVYDFLQDAEHIDSRLNVSPTLQPNSNFSFQPVVGKRDIRVNDRQGQRVMYVARNPINDTLSYVNHFCNGLKFRRDQYDSRGFLSRIQYLHETLGSAVLEHFLRPNGSLAVAKFYRVEGGKMVLQNIRLHNHAGDLIDSFPDEQAMIAYTLEKMLLSKAGKHLLVVDKNRLFYKPALLAQDRIHLTQPNSVAVVPIIHAVHTKSHRDIQNSATNENFKDVLHDILRPDAIVTLTEQQKIDIEARYGQGRIFCIGHSYESSIVPAAFEQRDRFRIVSMARYSPEKNQHLAIKAFEKVLRKHPQASLDFYGFGDTTLAKLRSLVKTLGLEGSVRLNGWANTPSVHYESAGLSLLTSQTESFSLAIMESICHGCPPVAFDVPYGPAHLIDQGKTGMLVPFGDVDALANSILSVFDNPEYHAQLSARSREEGQRFKSAELARRWCSLFESLGVSLPKPVTSQSSQHQ